MVGRICSFLDAHGCAYDSFAHEAVRTSAEAAAVRTGYTMAEGAKSLIVRTQYRGDSKKYFVLIVVPGDMRFDVKKARKALNARDIRFAREEEVLHLTEGILPGGVPPFGNLFDLPVYADASLFSRKRMICNAGDRKYSIALDTACYKRTVRPHIVDLII